MFKKKTPTPAQRIAQAATKAGSAVAVFHNAAADLEDAATEHRTAVEELDAQIGDKHAELESIVAEINAEIDALDALANHAEVQEAEHLDAAARIRSLFA